MKYKVGDRVRIKSLDWYNKNKSKRGNISFPYEAEIVFTSEMSSFCGQIVTISQKGYTQDVWFYRIKEDRGSYMWTDEMIEGLVEEENTLKIQSNDMETETHRGYYTTEEETANKSKKVAWFTFGDNDFADKVELDLSDRELIHEDGKWFVVKKKKAYPKTYEECCEILQYNKYLTVYPPFNADIPNYDALHLFDLLEALRKLRICRDAYWKIAGEEMGLGKPWEPDWTNEHQVKYTIYTMGNDVIRHVGNYIHAILAFPTEEMRDAFYENFKELIEICKELL